MPRDKTGERKKETKRTNLIQIQQVSKSDTQIHIQNGSKDPAILESWDLKIKNNQHQNYELQHRLPGPLRRKRKG